MINKQGWLIYNWCDVLSIRNGKNQKKVENSQGVYPICGSGGIMGYANDYICPENTVILGRKGNINNPILMREKFWNVDTAFGLIPFIDKLNASFLYYFCLNYDFYRHNKAVTIPSLTKSDLLNVKISLPPIPIQNQIVKELDTLQAMITKKKAQLNELDKLAQATFYDMFGDPVENEKGWDITTLKDLGSLGRGISKHRPRNAPELLGGAYPLIQTGDVANASLYIDKYTQTYSEKGLKQSKLWAKGTLCITIAANIAKTAILSFNSCFPDSIVGFINNNKTNIIFIHYWFSFFQKILEDQAPEVAQKNINLKILNDLVVISPPLPLQNQFAQRIEAIEKQKALINQSIAETQLLFDSAMDNYFN